MLRRSLLALSLLLAGPALAEVPAVVATIKPIHSLVVAVMGDLGAPTLIVKGAASPHTYSMTPSDAGAIQAAKIIFWTGHDFELFLEDALATLAPNATVVALGTSPGIQLLPARQGGVFEAHADEPAEGHAHEQVDMHMFLDPENAKAMVARIATTLSVADPEHATTYAANAAAETAALDTLIADLTTTLAPIKDVPFVVFHDAYQYFEARFGLSVAGSITVNPESMPGADRIAEIRTKLKTLSTACVFAEPQFDPRLIDVLIEGTSAGKGTLDPEGANLTEGRGLYAELLRGLTTSLVECLSR